VTRSKRFAFDVMNSVTGDTIVLRILESEAGIGIVYAVLYALRVNGVRCLAKTRCIGSVFREDLAFKANL